jgi:hypothetical protein
MNMSLTTIAITVFSFCSLKNFAQNVPDQTPNSAKTTRHLYIDVHELGAGKVKFEDVAKAHAKDLSIENKYGVEFIKYWVDEKEGKVYCLSNSINSDSIAKTHAAAHGLLPAHIYQVTGGEADSIKNLDNLFLDIHYLPGSVTAKEVAAAHAKDLETQKTYGVNFINYWVDEKKGVVMCLSEAKDPKSIIKTHKEAHGLIPAQVLKVKQGN